MGKISKAISSILCGVLVIGAVAGAGTALYMGGKNNGWFDEYKKPDTEQSQSENDENIEVSEGMVIAPETNGKQMRVTSKALSVSEYSDYGVSAQAENAYTLTAEVLPDYASDKRVNWSVAWADSNSQWAKGKNVTNYVTVTPSSDGSTTAVLACTQDFGELVILTVSSRSNPDVSSSALVNYYQRIKSLNYTFKLDGETVSTSADSHGVYKFDYTGAEKNYTVELNPVYSAFTLTDNFTTTINGKLSSTFGYTAASTLKELTISAGISGGELKDATINQLRGALELYVGLMENYDSTREGEFIGVGTQARTIVQCCSTLKSSGSTHPYYLHVKDLAEQFDYQMTDFYGSKQPSCSKRPDLSTLKARLNSYVAPAYNYYGANIPTYNDFVSAVKKCNSAGVGVLQYTIKIKGTYSDYETVLNLSYNDEFKTNVQNVNMSDITVAF